MTRIFTCLYSGLATVVFILVAHLAFGSSNPAFSSTTISDPLAFRDLGGFTLSMDDVSATQGEEICLPVTVNGFTDVIGMQFSINYDDAALSYSTITNFNLPGLTMSNYGTPDNGQSPGNITISWLDNTFAGVTVPDGDPIFEVCFNVTAENATAGVSFSNSPVIIEVIDANDNELSASTDNATVTIGDGGGTSGGLMFTLSDETVAQGQQVCVGVSVDGFSDLIGIQYTINYDPVMLDFASVTSFNLTGLSGANFGTPDNGTADGVITMSWLDNTFAGVSLPDGTQIFEVCFNATGSGNTNVSFGNSPVVLEVLDSNDNTVDATTNDGSVNITGGGGNNLGITVANETVAQGQMVCVGVSVDQFTDLIGMQFTLGYDPSALTFNAVSSLNLEGLTLANFGTPDTGTDDGVITLSWTDNTFAGVSVPNGTQIFEVCFVASGAAGTSNVNFQATPVALEVIDVDEQDVTASTQNGSVTITGGTGGGEGLMVNVSNETIAQGEEVCVEVSVDDFIDIIGAQFTINYDAGQLTFNDFQSLNLAGLSASNFGNPNAGVLTFSWLDNTFAGVTVPAGTVIFEACFTASGNNGTTPVTVGGSPVAIEFIDANDQEVAAMTSTGSVTITGGSTGGGGEGLMVNVSDETVAQGESVCVEISVDDFIDIIGAQFTINYDAGALTFDDFQSLNLAGLTAANFGNPSAGVLTFSWLDNTFAGVTVPAGTVIFEACFTATGGSGTTAVTVGNSPVTVEFIDANDQEVTAQTNAGSVSITGGTGGGDGLMVNVSDETVAQGESVCVEISVDDFIDIIGAQFTINYDAGALTFDDFQSLNLAGLTAANFGNPSAGVLTFSWLDNTFAGVTVPAGTVIFEACFTATGGSGTTAVTVGSSPVTVEFIDANDQEVTAQTNAGSVSITGGTGGGDGLMVNVSDETVVQGESVCVEISVDDFIDIIGAQFTINYDAGALTFDDFQSLNLAGLTAANFGNPSAGVLTFSWLDNTFAGVTVPAGTVIFEACFTATGGSGTTAVTVGSSPVTVEFIDANDQEVTAQTNAGSVTITGGTGGGDGLMVNVSDETVAQGESVCVEISVDDFIDIIGAQFTINYDAGALTFDDFQSLNLAGLTAANFGNPSAGVLTFSWLDNTFAGVTVPAGTVIFEACFTATGGSGTTAVTVGNSPVAVEFIDVDDNEVTAQTNNGSVTITGGTGGGDGLTVNVSDETVAMGESVCVEVSVDDFIDIIGAQFTINYDAGALTFDDFQSLNLAGLTAANFGNPSAGVLTFSWLDNSFAGVTVPAATVIFEACFTATGGSGTTAVTVGNSPVAVEFIDVNDNEVTAQTNNGSVTITGGTGGGDGLTVNVSDETVAMGESVCVEVSVDDFIDIIGAQFTINYDAGALTFDDFQSLNLTGLTAANFGNPSAGVLTFSWLDNSFAGVTVPATTVIFEACFTATGGSGTTAVTVGNSPVAVEFIDVDDNEVTAQTNNGSVTITGGTGGGDGLMVNVSDETVAQGESVCVEISVDDFIDIIGAQFTINYDAGALTFDDFQSLNLAGLTAANFGNPSAGVLTFSWLDNSFAGVTVPAGTVIFEACFTATGAAGTYPVTIGNSPVAVEFIDVNDNEVTAQTNDGSVTIGGTGGGDDVIVNVSDESVEMGQNVCVEVSVDNFEDIIGAQFTINYDDGALMFDDFQSLNLTGLTAANFGNPSAGVLTFSWLDNSFNGVTVADGTVIFEACFTATGSIGTYPVTIGNSPVAVEFIDVNDNEVTAQTNDGSVTITDGNGGGSNDGFGLTLSEETAMTGETVCLDMSVNNFGSITGLDFSIEYNETLLDFSSIGAFNLVGLDISDFNFPGGGATTGTISLSWDNGSPVSLPDGTVLFEVCFNVIGDGGNVSAVSFTSDPVAINITDGEGGSVPTDLDHGAVTILSDGGNNYDGFTLVLTEETAENMGEEVCVSMEVYDFADVVGMQFTINYDPSMLDYTSIQNINLQGLTEGNFGTEDNGQMPGTITFSWTDADLTGETYPDGTTLFDVCFTTLFDNGSTPVEFGNSPVVLEVIDINDNEIDADTDNGSVTIGGSTGAEGFALFIEDINTNTGETICLDVTAQDFIDLNGIQFTILYDETALQFESVGAFNLPGLDATGNFNPNIPGEITFTWNDETLNGVTLMAPDTTLFEVCFEVIGTSSTAVTFGDSPAAIEAVDVDDNIIEPIDSDDPGIVTISTAVPPSITNFVVTDISCNGENDGIISIDEITGDGPFAYLWSVVGQDGSTISGLEPGEYFVTVVDASTTLLTSTSFTVEEPDQLEISSIDVVDVVCSNDATGSITITVTGGTMPYAVEWSNGLPDGLVQNNLEAGIYTVTVTDARGCTVSETITVEATNNPLNITSLIPVNVPGGAINLTVAGGTGAGTYDFSWTGPGAYTATTEDLTGLSQPGIYCVTVTDNAGCTDEACVEVGEDIIINSFQITNTCVGESQGAIDIDVTGGVGMLTYQWAYEGSGPISLSQDISGQPAGNYSVTISDVNNNQVTGSFEIQEYPTLTYGATIGPAINGNDGSVVLNNFMNGTPLSYQWSPNVNNTTFEAYNLTPGQYCVTVTDQNGCETEACYMVPAAPLNFTGETTTDATCNTYTDGILSVTVSGGIPPYTYTADAGPSPMTNVTGAFMVNTLGAGTVNYQVTDSQGSVISGSSTIGQPDPITYNSAVVNDVEGAACTGKIVLNIEGGTGPYTVTWNSGIGGTQPIGLCGGDYIPSITDSNGCQLFATEAIVVSELSDSVSIVDVTCMGDEDGGIDLFPYGANEYSFEWRLQGSPVVISTDEDLGDFGPGVYTVEITDETGAVLINTYEIGTQSNLDVEVNITSNYNGYAVKCFDSSDGAALANAFDGIGVYAYEWELDGELYSVGANLTGAPAGTYDLIAIDDLGCEAMASIDLSAPPELNVVEAVENVSCDGLEDGSIEVAGFGGVPDYVYQWSNPNIGSLNNFLIAGDYGLTVTDGNGCIIERNYNITEPSPIEVSIIAEPATEPGTGFSDCSGSNGSVSAIVTGGNGEYNYNWLNIEVIDLNQDVVTGLCPGPYYLQVTDSNGCESLSGTVVGEVEDRRFPCLEQRVVITPDGNGSNDNFIIFCIGDLPDNHLQIFNRWGQLVYETDNYDNSWEGTSFKGEPLPEGPYYFILEYQSPDGLIQTKGSLTIVR